MKATPFSASLVDLVSFVVDNRGLSCPTETHGTSLIATNCIKSEYKYPVKESVRFVSDDTMDNWFRSHPIPGDVIFVCKGSPGRVAVAPDPVDFVIAQDMVALRANSKVVDPGFLYYLLSDPETTRRIEGLHVGTMIPHFKKGDFGKLWFEIRHEIPEQRAIAEVLGALDDKIAANGVLLECIEDWVRQSVAAQKLPETTLDSLADAKRVSINPAMLEDPVVEHYSLPAYDAGRLPVTESPQGILSSKFVVDRPSVLVSKLNPRFPRVWDCPVLTPAAKSIASTEFVVLEPRSVSSTLLWSTLIQPQFGSSLESKVAGTSGSHQRIRPSDVMATTTADVRELPVPLAAVISSLGLQSHCIRAESVQLSSLRDTLLPELMSGRLRVKDAERQVEDVV